MAKKQNIPTVVDPKKRNFLSYKDVTLFKPNLKELREGLKLEISTGNQDQVQHATSLLKEKLNAQGIMVTLSEHGVYIDYKNQKVKLPAYDREISAVSGEADAMISEEL